MEIETIKELIKKYKQGHSDFVLRGMKAEAYYRNKTDILLNDPKKTEAEAERPLRNADNRIPFNFHGLLVNQKASYLYAKPPVFDVGADSDNKKLTQFLGDKFAKVCKDLCINASNYSIAWVHVWKDKKGAWKYASVPPDQVIPVWSKDLEKELEGVFRVYREIDEDTGDQYTVYEYWNDVECSAYRLKTGDVIDLLQPYYIFSLPGASEETSRYRHEVGEIPFFPFFNNNIDTGDLDNIKPLIDSYCKVFSGFVNDLEDIQEIIFVLTNYGGQDLGEFIRELKNYKAIKVENHGDGDRSGVSTLTIELPVEARKELLSTTRKCIFEQGQGIDPDPQNFGNSSGVALNFLYALLELKAGLQETEFRLGFARLIRCMCRLIGASVKDEVIIQTWTRTAVRNDQELSQIAQQSVGVISKKTIVTNHPWVENAEQELANIEAEEKEETDKGDLYEEAFDGSQKNGDIKSSDGDGDE